MCFVCDDDDDDESFVSVDPLMVDVTRLPHKPSKNSSLENPINPPA